MSIEETEVLVDEVVIASIMEKYNKVTSSCTVMRIKQEIGEYRRDPRQPALLIDQLRKAEDLFKEEIRLLEEAGDSNKNVEVKNDINLAVALQSGMTLTPSADFLKAVKEANLSTIEDTEKFLGKVEDVENGLWFFRRTVIEKLVEDCPANCFPSNRRLAEVFCVNESTIRDWFKKLKIVSPTKIIGKDGKAQKREKQVRCNPAPESGTPFEDGSKVGRVEELKVAAPQDKNSDAECNIIDVEPIEEESKSPVADMPKRQLAQMIAKKLNIKLPEDFCVICHTANDRNEIPEQVVKKGIRRKRLFTFEAFVEVTTEGQRVPTKVDEESRGKAPVTISDLDQFVALVGKLVTDHGEKIAGGVHQFKHEEKGAIGFHRREESQVVLIQCRLCDAFKDDLGVLTTVEELELLWTDSSGGGQFYKNNCAKAWAFPAVLFPWLSK